MRRMSAVLSERRHVSVVCSAEAGREAPVTTDRTAAMVLHRTVKMVLLALGVTISGFIGTSLNELQNNMTDDDHLQAGLTRFQLLPQMLGEAMMLFVWYWLFAETPKPPPSPAEAVGVSSASGGVRRGAVPISVRRERVHSSGGGGDAKHETAFGSLRSTTVVVGMGMSAAPKPIAADAAHAEDAKTAVVSADGNTPLLAVPSDPAAAAAAASVWSALPSWRVLLPWGMLLCWCDIIITSGPGRDWITYSADNTVRGLYAPMAAILCRFLLRGLMSGGSGSGGGGSSAAADSHVAIPVRTTLSWRLWGCIAISTCGFIVFGVGDTISLTGWCEATEDNGTLQSGAGYCAGGTLMTLFHYALMAVMNVLEERVMRTHNLHPVFLVGLEGVCGLFWVIAIMGFTFAVLPEFFLNTGVRDIGPFLRTPLWWLTNVPLVVVLAAFNACQLAVIAHAGVVVRALTNGARLAVSWSGQLLVGWDQSPWYVAPGYYCLVAGALLYFLSAELDAPATAAASDDTAVSAELKPHALHDSGDAKLPNGDSALLPADPFRSAGYGAITTAYDSVHTKSAPTDVTGAPVGASAGAAAVAAAATGGTASPSLAAAATANGVHHRVVRVTPCAECGCDQPTHALHAAANARAKSKPKPIAAVSSSVAMRVPVADDTDFEPKPVLVALVIVSSLAYLIGVQVLGQQTGAIALADAIGCSVMLACVLVLWVLQPHPTYAEFGWSAGAGDGNGARVGLLNDASAAPPARGGAMRIAFNRAWGTGASHRLLSAMLYWGTWAAYLPAFAALSRQCILSPDTLGAGTGHVATAVVENVLRGFSVVVLLWCVLPLRDVTHAYAKRDLLTRVILDLIDAYGLVDATALTDPVTGAGLNPNASTFDSALCGCALLFSGLTLFFVAISGAASGLQDSMTQQIAAPASPAAVALDGSGAPRDGDGVGAGPGPSSARAPLSLHPHVRLYWALLPYVCSLVFNNVPFLVLRIAVWAHTGSVSVALVGKNALGILLCALFIGSALKPVLSAADGAADDAANGKAKRVVVVTAH